MAKENIFDENITDVLLSYCWHPEHGIYRLVYRPVDYSPFQDSRWMLEKGIWSLSLSKLGNCTSLSGFVITPQKSIIVWSNYKTTHTFIPTHLSIALRLFSQRNLFEYIVYNEDPNFPVGGLKPSLDLLHRHYCE